MDQTMKPFSSEGTDTRRWIGRIIMAVILGEAIWGLIVSVMNNVVVPWLGDVMGQSSGLPTSFTQRPYNYPDLFVSILEFGIAALVAAVLNYFFQGPDHEGNQGCKEFGCGRRTRANVPSAHHDCGADPNSFAVHPARAGNQGGAGHGTGTAAVSATPPPAPAAEPAALAPPAPPVTEPTAARPLPTAPAARTAATKPSLTPKTEPPNPKKPKEVYYNIVGEPMPSDDD